MTTFFEVLLWIVGEILLRLILPYLIVFGVIIPVGRFLTPTWRVPMVITGHKRWLYRFIRSIAWGIDLGFGNNNRRGWFLFPALIPFILWWGFSQPLGPPTLEKTIHEAEKTVPLVLETKKGLTGLAEQWDATLHSFQTLAFGKREANLRKADRQKAQTAAKATEPARRAAIIAERYKDWSRYLVGRTIGFLWIPFVIVYALLAGREELTAWAQGIVASRQPRQPSPPAPTGATAGATPAPATPTGGQRGVLGRLVSFLGFFELAEILLAFYRMVPGRR